MRTEIFSRWLSGFLLLAAALVTAAGMAQAPAPARASGKITALVPLDFVLREQKSLDARKDMPVFWGDTVKTERGGRVRVQLEDGSILNVGSQSSLLIQRHDANTQQTELELIYGRVRANAVKIATPSGEFNVRTRAAVAGVVGTEEYLDATDILTTVIALGGGQVVVISTDPRFPDPIFLNPGEAVTLIAGRRPPPKRLATTEELVKAVQETEVDAVATLNPSRALPGGSFEATISGKGLNTFTKLSFSQPGLQVQTRGEVTATQIPVTITVAANVPPGTYPLTIERPGGPARSSLVVTTKEAMQAEAAGTADSMQPPPSQSYSVTRGAKLPLDASSTRTPSGTQIVSYQWQVLNKPLSSRDATFAVNTSLLPPGNYTIQLVVVNDRGQTATQQYPLTVDRGIQPAEIIRAIANAYESLQPTDFLRYFDEQKFRNYSGFAAAIEDSFRNQLDTVRVFQRPVNCSVVEEQDQAVCQADFQLQFTKKSQPSELLDAQGNPIPSGISPPPGALLGKRVLTGSERTTIRDERGNAGWKVVDYSAAASCPGGATTKGLNVGSCILALGSASAPSFQIVNLQLFSTDLLLGGSVSGTFAVVPMGGFNGSITFTGQGKIGNQSIDVQFTPNPSGPTGTISFTVFAPTTAPTVFSGAQPFTLVITGQDSSGSITATVNAALVLQPDFSLTLNPATTSSASAPVTHNITLPLTVQVVPSTGFAGTVFIDFPNLPTGFQATPGNVAASATGSFPVRVTSAAVPGPALLTVRGTLGPGFVKTATFFVDVISDFALNVSPPSTPNPLPVAPGGTIQLSVRVVPISGFAGTVSIDFLNLPTGFHATPGTVTVGEPGSFPVQVDSTVSAGPNQFTVRGTFGPGSVQTVTVFVQVTIIGSPGSSSHLTGQRSQAGSEAKKSDNSGDAPFFLTTNPPTSLTAPLLLQKNSQTNTFANIHVTADGSFAGLVKLSLKNVPTGVTATLVPSVVDLSASTLQVVQLQFQTTTSQVAFGPTGIQITAASGSLTSDTAVFVVSQAGSGLPTRGDRNPTRPPHVLQGRYPGGTPGAYTPVTILGESLSSITSVLSDSLLLSATPEPGVTDSQLQLSVFVKPGAPPGTYTLMLVGPQCSVPIAFQVKPGELQVEEEHSAINSRPTSPSGRSRTTSVASAHPARSVAVDNTDQQADEVSVAPRNVFAAPPSPDVVLRADDLTMTPANPRPGDTVTFRVRITNQSAQPAEDAAFEFSIAGTSIRQREHVSLAPKESQTFQFEWRAAGNGRLEPRVVIDPENRIKGLNRANTAASLRPFELVQLIAAGATPGRAVSKWERAKVRLTAGGCVGFRFASGTEQPCGAGADFELRSSPGGEALVS